MTEREADTEVGATENAAITDELCVSWTEADVQRVLDKRQWGSSEAREAEGNGIRAAHGLPLKEIA